LEKLEELSDELKDHREEHKDVIDKAKKDHKKIGKDKDKPDSKKE